MNQQQVRTSKNIRSTMSLGTRTSISRRVSSSLCSSSLEWPRRDNSMIILLVSILLINSILATPITPTSTNSDHQLTRIGGQINPDPIGEAFRRQISALSDPGSDRNMPHIDQKNRNKSGSGSILIDSLSMDEIIDYQRTGRLPNRSKALIKDFLEKTPQGQKLLQMERQTAPMKSPSSSSEWGAIKSSASSSLSFSLDPISLLPSDRYEIVRDGGQTVMMPNEHEFGSAELSHLLAPSQLIAAESLHLVPSEAPSAALGSSALYPEDSMIMFEQQPTLRRRRRTESNKQT